MPENTMPEAGNALANLNRTERAAILLMSLGEKDAAEILKHMGPKEVQRVGSAMATMTSVNQTQVEGVVSEFLDAVSGTSRPPSDAAEGIRVLRVLDACQQSILRGTAMDLAPQ